MGRTRAPAFSLREERLLIELVKKRKDIIENKKTDQSSNELKIISWKQIEEEFNTNDGCVYRNYNMLRGKYENMKKRTRRKLADLKSYSIRSDGGTLKDLDLTPVEKEVGELVVTQILGLPSGYDSDTYTGTIKLSPSTSLLVAQDQSEAQPIQIIEPVSQSPVVVLEPDPVLPNVITPSRTAGGKWKQLGAMQTRKVRRTTMAKSFSRLAEAKSRNAECDRLHQQEMHELKMAQLKELHQQEIKFRLEKHQMELKILAQQLRHAEEIHKHDMDND